MTFGPCSLTGFWTIIQARSLGIFHGGSERDEALFVFQLGREEHRMYTTPKIIASLDANVVLSAAVGDIDIHSKP
jgi:hypothetical protein